MANTIIVTGNVNNFTIAFNTIQQDFAYNSLSHFIDSVDNRFVDIIERRTDGRKYRFDTTDDTITVNGATGFADATALSDALKNAMYSTAGSPTGDGVQSVTGDGVNNSDPANPVMSYNPQTGTNTTNIGVVAANLVVHESNNNNPHNTTAEQVGLFTPAYAEIYRSTKGTQVLVNAGEVIDFDTAGLSQGVAVDLVDNKLTVQAAGVYQVALAGAVDVDGSTDYAVFSRVNGANTRQVTNMEGGASQKPAIVGIGIVQLAAGDEIQCFVNPTSDTSDFFLEIGTTFQIKRIG